LGNAKPQTPHNCTVQNRAICYGKVRPPGSLLNLSRREKTTLRFGVGPTASRLSHIRFMALKAMFNYKTGLVAVLLRNSGACTGNQRDRKVGRGMRSPLHKGSR